MRFKKGHFMTIPSAVFFSDLTPREKVDIINDLLVCFPKGRLHSIINEFRFYKGNING